MPHILFGPELREMLEENDDEGIRAFLQTLHPATVADALTGEMSVDQMWKVLGHTEIRHQAAIFEYLPPEWQVKLVEGTGREHMAHLIEQMSHDDRVDLMRRLSPRAYENLLRLVDEADRRDIANLVKQDPNTAAGLMTTNYAWVPPNITATEAMDRLRLQAPDRETIYYIYVLDEQHRLQGVVSLRNLIMSPRHQQVRDIMDDQLITLKPGQDRTEVAKLIAQYDLLAVPVTDDSNRLVGIVTHDDVIDAVVEQATEDAHRMGGVAPLEESFVTANFFTVWRKRAFWLSCLFGAELFASSAIQLYEKSLEKAVVLMFFVPLCISTGGNSGSQASTLVIRAMALGQLRIQDWFRVLRNEFTMGIALGLTLGLIGFVRGYLNPLSEEAIVKGIDHATLGVVVAISVMACCVWGTMLGAMLPIFFRRFNIDPGVASGPFVATFVDVTGIIIYFQIANHLIVRHIP